MVRAIAVDLDARAFFEDPASLLYCAELGFVGMSAGLHFPLNAKTMVPLLAPTDEVPHLVSTIVERARLHQQATGAVFSTPCDHAYFGSEFNVWPSRDDTPAAKSAHNLTENLNIIYCTVGHKLSDRVSKAAISAGAHGPIVYYGEGRGLRDRLGWLRITKEHEQEVLMVIADESDADQVFDAMAKAGELHLPGRGRSEERRGGKKSRSR